MAKPVVLVTGGGKRIGAEISKLLINSGFFVLIHVNNSVAQAEQIIADNMQSGEKSGDVIRADLSDDLAIKSMIETVKTHKQVIQSGGLAGLVHNASLYEPVSFEELTLETFRLYQKIHVETPFYLTSQLLSELKNANGCVVGIVDTSQGRSWDQLSHYTSSKSGLRQLMTNLAGDLSPDVRVNCVAPGAIISASWELEHFASVIEKVPMERSGSPKDIANAVKFLLESDHISGQTLFVDGGWNIVE